MEVESTCGGMDRLLKPWKLRHFEPKEWRVGSDDFRFPIWAVLRFHDVNFLGCNDDVWFSIVRILEVQKGHHSFFK